MSCVCCVFATVLLSRPADAQDDPFAELTEEQAADLHRLLSEAEQAEAAERWSEAYDAYVQAEEILPLEEFRYSQGWCMQRSGDENAALEIYRALQVSPRPEIVEAATRAIEALEPLVAEPQISVWTDPAGAEIRIDGQLVGFAEPEGTVLALPEGAHIVELRLNGFEPVTREVTAAPGQTAELVEALVSLPDESPNDERNLALPLTLGGAAIAAVGTGIAFGLLSQTREQEHSTYDIDQTGADPRELDAIGDEAEDYALGATISFAATGVLASAALVTYFLGGSSTPAEDVEITLMPSVSPTLLGGTLEWRF